VAKLLLFSVLRAPHGLDAQLTSTAGLSKAKPSAVPAATARRVEQLHGPLQLVEFDRRLQLQQSD